jgi:hypothetical protein
VLQKGRLFAAAARSAAAMSTLPSGFGGGNPPVGASPGPPCGTSPTPAVKPKLGMPLVTPRFSR